MASSNSTFSDDKKDVKQDPREYLIVACGHSLFGCSCHPKSTFITLDINPKLSPDIVCDVKNFASEHKKRNFKPFAAVVFEKPSIDWDFLGFLGFSRYLKDNGTLIYNANIAALLCYSIVTLNQAVPSNLKVWLSTSGSHLVFPKNGQLSKDPILNKYLEPAVKEQKLVALTFTDDIKKRIQYLSFFTRMNMYKSGSDKLVRCLDFEMLLVQVLLLSVEPLRADMTIADIKAKAERYSPGPYKSFFGKKSDEMNGLLECIDEISKNAQHKVTEQELMKILTFISENRRPNSETQRVFDTIVVSILHQLTCKHIQSLEQRVTPNLKLC